MARNTNARMVLVTCGSLSEARKIARTVVDERLAACVNILAAPIHSVYRWKGRVEAAKELLLIIKTTAPKLKALEKEVARLHRYDVPEFLVLRVESGAPSYLKWLQDSVAPAQA